LTRQPRRAYDPVQGPRTRRWGTPSAPHESSIAAQLAAFCAELRFADLPRAPVERAKELLLDFLGVCFRGMDTESSQAAVRSIRALSPPGAASILGDPTGAPAAWAALANGTAAHALEMDDVTARSSLHPGVAVFPAALALSEELGSRAEDLLVAVAAGYEVTMRVGNALNAASAYRRGFHPTGVAGAFGAAAASATLLRLDAERTAHALGVAGTMAAGSLEYLSDGSWTKRLNAGWAAHCGVVAARLAAAGFTGPSTAIEGPLGLLRGHSDSPLAAEATAGLGAELQLMRVSIKPYACCRYNHGLIDCVLQIRRGHEIALEDVEEIRLGVLSGGALLVAEPIEQKRAPRNVVDAQFSAAFAAAIALARGGAGYRDYCLAAVDDPVIRGLMQKVSCYRDAKLDAAYPDHWPAAVMIRLRDGTTLEARQPDPLGSPENPVDRAGLEEKFGQLVDRPFAPEVARQVWSLPEGSVDAILRPFIPASEVGSSS